MDLIPQQFQCGMLAWFSVTCSPSWTAFRPIKLVFIWQYQMVTVEIPGDKRLLLVRLSRFRHHFSRLMSWTTHSQYKVMPCGRHLHTEQFERSVRSTLKDLDLTWWDMDYFVTFRFKFFCQPYMYSVVKFVGPKPTTAYTGQSILGRGKIWLCLTSLSEFYVRLNEKFKWYTIHW